MSIGMSPFKALYGYEAPTFADLLPQESRVPSTQEFIQQSTDILKTLKENIQQAQNPQKIYADQRRTERTFEEGDLVFLRLQPYKQTSIKKNGAEKLKPRFYGPYKILRKIGAVAYELQLPEGSKIHSVFHVSWLKKVLGKKIEPCAKLPPLNDEGHLVLNPEVILDTQQKKLRNKTIIEYLIKWRNLPSEDATWEREDTIKLLEDKQNQAGKTVIAPHHMS